MGGEIKDAYLVVREQEVTISQERKFSNLRAAIAPVEGAVFSDSKTGVYIRTGDEIVIIDRRGKKIRMKVGVVASKVMVISRTEFKIGSGILALISRLFGF